jgi:hypothetical protein
MPEEGQKANGTRALLATLAQSGHAWIQFGTLVLIGLSGFGNWAATWNSADRNKNEIEVSRRVAWEGEQRIKTVLVQQVSEIHAWLKGATEEFHKGNEDSAVARKILADMKTELDGYEARQLQELVSIDQSLKNLKKKEDIQ